MCLLPTASGQWCCWVETQHPRACHLSMHLAMASKSPASSAALNALSTSALSLTCTRGNHQSEALESITSTQCTSVHRLLTDHTTWTYSHQVARCHTPLPLLLQHSCNVFRSITVAAQRERGMCVCACMRVCVGVWVGGSVCGEGVEQAQQPSQPHCAADIGVLRSDSLLSCQQPSLHFCCLNPCYLSHSGILACCLPLFEFLLTGGLV
jgi:hypothetical protein